MAPPLPYTPVWTRHEQQCARGGLQRGRRPLSGAQGRVKTHTAALSLSGFAVRAVGTGGSGPSSQQYSRARTAGRGGASAVLSACRCASHSAAGARRPPEWLRPGRRARPGEASAGAAALAPGQAGWEGLSSDQRQESSGAVTVPLTQGVATRTGQQDPCRGPQVRPGSSATVGTSRQVLSVSHFRVSHFTKPT